MDTNKHILLTAEKLFMQYGFRSVGVDDIARECGISKKTLYQYIENKGDLVKQVMQRHLDEESTKQCQVTEVAENAIDEIVQIYRSVSQHMIESLKSNVLFELQKYYPESWNLFQAFKNEVIYPTIKKNLERGVAEGLYRNNLNIEIVTRLYLNNVEATTNLNLFPINEYRMYDVYKEFITYHIRAIMSPEGLEYFTKFKNKAFNE